MESETKQHMHIYYWVDDCASVHLKGLAKEEYSSTRMVLIQRTWGSFQKVVPHPRHSKIEAWDTSKGKLSLKLSI